MRSRVRHPGLALVCEEPHIHPSQHSESWHSAPTTGCIGACSAGWRQARRACVGGLAPGHWGHCSQTGRGIVMLSILASSAAGNAVDSPPPRNLALLEPLGKQPWLCAGRRPYCRLSACLTLVGTAKQRLTQKRSMSRWREVNAFQTLIAGASHLPWPRPVQRGFPQPPVTWCSG